MSSMYDIEPKLEKICQFIKINKHISLFIIEEQ